MVRLYIDPSGNVGIGTTTPSGVLDLGSATAGRALSWGGSSANYSNIFTSYSAGGLVMASGFRGSAAADSYVSSYGGGALARSGIRTNISSDGIQFFTDTSATIADGSAYTATERMRITGAGNVGIGTTSPAHKLDVSGTANATTFNVAQEIVSTSCAVPTGGSCTANATCPGGKALLSGGYANSWTAVEVLYNFPSSVPNWQCLFYTAGTGGVSPVCYALCGKIQ